MDWERSVVTSVSNRWHRSLQLRVVATTLAISAAVIAVLGFFLTEQISAGLLVNAEHAAVNQVRAGVSLAERQPGFTAAPGNSTSGSHIQRDVQEALQQAASSGNGTSTEYYVAVRFIGLPGVIPYSRWLSDIDAPKSVPIALRHAVEQEQQGGGSGGTIYYTPTTMLMGSGSADPQPALAYGSPLGPYYQLYFLFPLSQEQQTLLLVQRVLIGAGIALVALLAAIASLVTRWVVLPVRHAAQAAQRLSAGRLEERMAVGGADDLGSLATSFNEMAASLQEKLRELEDLSKVQRQFVSDVSHELRTPLSTIRMAADLLYESREQLDAASSRSAELLQSQTERFEVLLTDLLEISRHDANVATLDAESADVNDIVRRAADDAQQLAERRGCRIEFRLPLEPCMADVDRRRVERILRNLLVNAVEHGEDKDVVVTVAADSAAVAIAVRDHGVGLAPGEEVLVFDRFWRADPARARTTGGTGLGLAISLEDARLHAGWLQAWGEKGKGSVFRLTVPRRVGETLIGSPLPLGPDESELVITLDAELDGGQASGDSEVGSHA